VCFLRSSCARALRLGRGFAPKAGSVLTATGSVLTATACAASGSVSSGPCCGTAGIEWLVRVRPAGISACCTAALRTASYGCTT
jgi:hypothetical protein